MVYVKIDRDEPRKFNIWWWIGGMDNNTVLVVVVETNQIIEKLASTGFGL